MNSEIWFKRKKLSNYSDNRNSSYHIHRTDVIRSLIKHIDFNDLRIIDFGCGEGIFLNEILTNYSVADATALDIDDEMLWKSKSLFANKTNVLVQKGGIEFLDSIDSGSTDVVFALNVMAYFSADDEKRFYKNISRILKKNGYFVVTHSNQIFDFFSLNNYTVDTISSELSGKEYKSKLSTLITNSEVLNVVNFGIRENPLNYHLKLIDYDLELKNIEYINYHKLPPLIDPLNREKRMDMNFLDTTKVSKKDRWKLNFQCSTFAALSTKL